MKKALLVGINVYSPQRSLRGCVNDATAMSKLLRETYSFDQVELLVDELATKTAVLDGLSRLLRLDDEEQEGVRVFFFAGHGGRVIDTSGDETDRVDENLCLSNYDWNLPETYILDDELGTALESGFDPKLRTYVVLDACHSGTGTRDTAALLTWEDIESVAQKKLNVQSLSELDLKYDDPLLDLLSVQRVASDPPELTVMVKSLTPTLTPQNSSIGLSSDNQEPTSHLLLSGCTANQTCKDVPIEQSYHGIFTYTLCQLLTANPNMSWQQVKDSVTHIISGTFNQNPQLEGASVMKARAAFS